jgi:transcriptional regulator with XRE-family HTH domain
MLGSTFLDEVVIMLGARIAALRREAGLSQAQLASVLKISPSAVGMYEQGRREPSADMLVAMAQAFHVSVDYLLTGCPSQMEATPLEQMLANRIAAADRRLESRTDRPFSRQELAVLFAAMLMEG